MKPLYTITDSPDVNVRMWTMFVQKAWNLLQKSDTKVIRASARNLWGHNHADMDPQDVSMIMYHMIRLCPWKHLIPISLTILICVKHKFIRVLGSTNRIKAREEPQAKKDHCEELAPLLKTASFAQIVVKLATLYEWLSRSFRAGLV